MKTQETLVVPILRKIFNAKVTSKDLTDREWDSQGVDKIVKQGKSSFFLSVRSRTHGGYKQRLKPLNVTIRSKRPIGSTEIDHLNARYAFYGVTDAYDNSKLATRFFWWVIYRMDYVRDSLENGQLKPGGELWEKYPDKGSWNPGLMEFTNTDGTKYLQIPISLLEEEKWIVARYTEDGGVEQIDRNADLYGSKLQSLLRDFIWYPVG